MFCHMWKIDFMFPNMGLLEENKGRGKEKKE
jgi:hypothetical protein